MSLLAFPVHDCAGDTTQLSSCDMSNPSASPSNGDGLDVLLVTLGKLAKLMVGDSLSPDYHITNNN